MDERSRVISAAQMAAVSNISHLTNDRIEALAGGHGMVNLSIYAVANVIVEELTNGGSTSIQFADVRHLPVETILKKCIDAAKAAGSDSVNAALITAVMMYLAGSAAQVGIPAGNRKLGATCRMLAGVDRSGAAAIPTAKMNNKISAFPAVMAVNQAMMNGELSPIDGRNVPVNVGGGPLYGHSALGEDIVWPSMAVKGAQIGIQAMMDAMAGASMVPEPFTCAILGCTPILEIIHPDAEVPEGMGRYGRTTSVRLVGEAAVEKAGLPEKLHFFVTNQELDTAQLVGDIALILKDIGAPSVIGMMAFDEILACFKEQVSPGFSGGPVNGPLGHQGAYAVVGMKALLQEEVNMDEIKKAICEERTAPSLDPESALVCMNTIARKADELRNGPVTKLLIAATEPARTLAIYKRANFTYDQIKAGKTMTEIVTELDNGRLKTVEDCTSALFTRMMGKKVTLKVNNIHSAARRTVKLAKKYWSFDAYADVVVTADDQVADMKGFVHDVIPAVCKGECQDVAWAVPIGAAALDELTLAGCNILNVVIPVATASAMKAGEVVALAEEAERAAYISVGIPGAKAHATQVGNMAVDIMNYTE
ncbi:hypothetical protein P261_01948 [Lachnospiraceae bacterium TWA4]|nr:hypothetical protein P261_01948 [Lachnospiraceae bacterium TWA4]